MIRILSPHSWHSILYLIRERPGAYLGSKSLRSLNNYVDGFRLAESIYRISEKDRLNDFDWGKFESWAREKTKLSMKSFMMPKGSDEEAFDQWFDWYDDYNLGEGKEDYEGWELHNKEQELQLTLPPNPQPWLY
jgi:hypothetical protein